MAWVCGHNGAVISLPLQPFSLEGEHVRLVPLAHAHRDALSLAVQDGDLDRLWFTNVPSPQTMASEIERRLALQTAGTMLPFTVIHAHSGEIVGMTSYMNMDTATPRVEIGSTWYAARVQRSALNTEAKWLLLQHAFGTFGCSAVELRTHFLNERSRRAIERLGARLDGVLRAHTITKNGTLRDTCVYSITAPEWPAVEAHLQAALHLQRR